MRDLTFTREDTKAVKGIAILMMMFHHMVTFSERYPQGFEGFKSLWPDFTEKSYHFYLGMHCRLCVAIFFFLGGYGMYKRWIKGKYSLKASVAALYKTYWKVFVIFIPIAFIFFARPGSGQLTERYVITDSRAFVTSLIANFVGLSDSLNSEWWFFSSFLCVLPVALGYCALTKKIKNPAIDFIVIVIIDILMRSVFSGIPQVSVFEGLKTNYFYNHFFNTTGSSPFFAGIFFAKYDILDYCKAYLMKWRISSLIGLMGCLAILNLRAFVLGETLDSLYAPVFIVFAAVFFESIKPLKFGMRFLGKYSTTMWLTHSFFCYYFLEAAKLVYCTRSVWVDFLILAALTTVNAVLLDYFYKFISMAGPKAKKLLLRKDPVSADTAEPAQVTE